MESLQTNLQKKHQLQKELDQLIRTSNLEIELKTNELNKLSEVVEIQLNSQKNEINENLLFKTIIGTSKCLKPTILFLKEAILNGELIDILESKDNISYWFNSGFNSGHARRMARYYGENNASERARITFAESLQENPELVTDSIIQNIIQHLNDILDMMESSDKWSQYLGQEVKLNPKYYGYLKDIRGKINKNGNTYELYQENNWNSLPLSNWMMTQYEITQ